MPADADEIEFIYGFEHVDHAPDHAIEMASDRIDIDAVVGSREVNQKVQDHFGEAFIDKIANSEELLTAFRAMGSEACPVYTVVDGTVTVYLVDASRLHG